MKVIAINGTTKTGKTTACEVIIEGLKKRGYSVGSVKEIHFEEFKIDPNNENNTNRHRIAGSQLVIARGLYETDVLYQKMLPIQDILKHFNHDFVVLEGVSDCNCPRIITGATNEDLELKLDGRVIAITGKYSNEHQGTYKDFPIINTLTEGERLTQFVIDNAFEPLPDFDPKCCSACGHTCRELTSLICQKKAIHSDCIVDDKNIHLTINGEEIQMVGFVQNILKNSVMGVVSELDGYKKDITVEVKFKI